MADNSTTREPLSFWNCLHDGSLEALKHEPLSETLTLIADVPYLWSFHSLPAETRFHILLQEALIMQVMDFQPWPGDTTLPDGLSWDEQQAIRNANYAKGSHTSKDWSSLVNSVPSAEYEFSNAYTKADNPSTNVLRLELANYQTNEYPLVDITFRQIAFYLNGDRKLSQQEFLSMGCAYWEDFAARASQQSGA